MPYRCVAGIDARPWVNVRARLNCDFPEPVKPGPGRCQRERDQRADGSLTQPGRAGGECPGGMLSQKILLAMCIHRTERALRRWQYDTARPSSQELCWPGTRQCRKATLLIGLISG